MNRRFTGTLLLMALALGFQAFQHALSDKMTVAQPLLALTAVLALRSGLIGGTVTGALLGALADTFQSHPVGFHGISFALAGYMLSWVGQKMLIRSVNPVVLFSLAAYLFDVGTVAGLHALLGLNLARSGWWWVLPGCLFTGFMAVALELAARRLLPPDRERMET